MLPSTITLDHIAHAQGPGILAQWYDHAADADFLGTSLTLTEGQALKQLGVFLDDDRRLGVPYPNAEALLSLGYRYFYEVSTMEEPLGFLATKAWYPHWAGDSGYDIVPVPLEQVRLLLDHLAALADPSLSSAERDIIGERFWSYEPPT